MARCLMSATESASGADVAQLMGGVPYLTLEELLAHPRLEEARRVFVDGFLAIYDGNHQAIRLISDASRFFVFHNIILLDAAYRPELPETWPTIGRIKSVLKLYGMSSDRAIDALLSRLRDLGFLETVASEMDGRLKLLRPTQQARAHDRDWLVAHYAPLACLYPERSYAQIMSRDPAFQLHQRRTSVAFLPLSASLVATQPEFLFFFSRAGGVMIEAAILQAAMRSEDGTHANISFAAMAKRFGLARTHVREVLRAAEAMGLVRLHGRGGQRVEILPRLWSAHARDMAIGLYLHGMIYAKAVAT
jgi:DNA-binding MarR family transcriptional regulator